MYYIIRKYKELINMKLCFDCELKFEDYEYQYCPYCGSELLDAVEVSWGGVMDEIAENSVTVEPQPCEELDVTYGYECL